MTAAPRHTAAGAPARPAYDLSGLHVAEAGAEGPLLLCLHGIGSSSASFGPQLAGLGGHARVLAWDAPGYADSADPEAPLDLDGFADVAAALLRSRGAREEPGSRAHVLGVSWGGVVAQRLALRHPSLVASLVLADSTAGSGGDPGKAEAMRARAAQLRELGPRAFARERAPRLVSAAAPEDLVRRVADTMAAAVRLPGYGYAAESMAATDLRADLPALAAPALVLCGDQDRVTGPEASQTLAGGIHRAAYVIVKDAGHLANQEQPERFNAWVLSHLHIVTE
ncbi:alpha/beta fold hydrolase [Streptomyces tubbatahanensis]|uniref:alpha/beta fold hydrolase n=1 Tax=Streptomyces tubbatahanensis TaxID=2923272 RepID=UPI003C6F9FAC